MEMMGANITIISEKNMGGEPVADLMVKSADLTGVIVEGELIPRSIDELTLVALAGSRASGKTLIRDAGELRKKETDRIGRTVDILRGFGVNIVGTDDGFVITGGAKLRPSVSDSYGDHRLAMLAAVAGILVEQQSHVTNASAVNISYPAFWSEFDRICGSNTIEGI
jgi:3-phosphoshikimate 1-carboxyvinyltransferase